ncbi:hypothetical protein ATANTOWER_005165 [Ataeniobius toweri]|uniref:Cytoglobin n=1 Tax=Ataeniobius toweri TaxID=208326 RepID=A0ABU7B4T6_9TELE|nr:hypothetical protein [Ataeniobius toweri]
MSRRDSPPLPPPPPQLLGEHRGDCEDRPERTEPLSDSEREIIQDTWGHVYKNCEDVGVSVLIRLKPEPFVFGSSDFLDAQVYLPFVDYVLDFVFWIKLAASWKFPTPEPRQRRTLSTLQHKYLNIQLS